MKKKIKIETIIEIDVVDIFNKNIGIILCEDDISDDDYIICAISELFKKLEISQIEKKLDQIIKNDYNGKHHLEVDLHITKEMCKSLKISIL